MKNAAMIFLSGIFFQLTLIAGGHGVGPVIYLALVSGENPILPSIRVISISMSLVTLGASLYSMGGRSRRRVACSLFVMLATLAAVIQCIRYSESAIITSVSASISLIILLFAVASSTKSAKSSIKDRQGS